MHVSGKVNIHNRFDIQVHDIDGNLKSEAVGFNNVLDQMFTRLCGGLSYFAYIHFGTGTGTLDKTRTTLFNHLETKPVQNVEKIKSIPVSSWKQKIVLNPEEFVGQIITEVGIAYGSASTNLVTHASLKDAEGNQISITKGATDVVTIFATTFVTFDTSIPELEWISMPYSNLLVNYLIGGAGAPAGSFGLLEILNSAFRLGSTPYATWTADIPNKKRKTNLARFDINTGNGNVKALEFTNLFSLNLPAVGIFTGKAYIDVPIGTGDGVTTKFLIPSKNLKDGSLEIKLNGVISTDYILKQIPNYVAIQLPPYLPSRVHSTSLNANGTVLAVGNYYSAPYVKAYDFTGVYWVERVSIPNLTISVYSINLSADGNVLAVGSGGVAPYVKVYDWNGSEWIERAQPPNLAISGFSVTLSADGNILAIGSSSATPYVKIYDWNGSEWIERAQLPNLAPNGYSVAMSANGNTIAIGSDAIAPYVKMYDWNENEWIEREQPSSKPARGMQVALSADGSMLAVASNTSSPIFYNAICNKIYGFEIIFNVAVVKGETITADYIVDGVHKTNQYIADASFSIQFAEGE